MPHYIDSDLRLPNEIKFDVGLGDFCWGLFTWHIEWLNIKYDNAIWDFNDVVFNITRILDLPLIKVDFPAIKKWEINADQTIDSEIVPANGPVRLLF